ncbi:hypothetical protein FS837_005578 [Tulasnella sp. UAMH 9824]|nr:hypothetical protein FS837_005578 [Tulasnella sp. UAMH 9824]
MNSTSLDKSKEGEIDGLKGDFSTRLVIANTLGKEMILQAYEATSGKWDGSPPAIIPAGTTISTRIKDGAIEGSEGWVRYKVALGPNQDTEITINAGCQVIGENKVSVSYNHADVIGQDYLVSGGHPAVAIVTLFPKA